MHLFARLYPWYVPRLPFFFFFCHTHTTRTHQKKKKKTNGSSGECATHFQQLLRVYKPQTSSRDAASQWGCHIHNLVNERLHKPEFDCGSVTETYKCGCADADEDEADSETKPKPQTKPQTKPETKPEIKTTEGITQGRRLTGAENVDLLEENTKGARVEVQKEG